MIPPDYKALAQRMRGFGHEEVADALSLAASLQDDKERLQDEIERLKEYVQHKPECKKWMRLDDGDSMVVPDEAGIPEYCCSCGLEALTAADSPRSTPPSGEPR